MSDLGFEIVSDDLRTEARATVTAPWVEAVLEGLTVKVDLSQTRLGGYYKTFTKRGYKLRTRAAGEQTIVWAELRETEEAPKGKK